MRKRQSLLILNISFLEPVVRDKAVDDVVVLADADAHFWLHRARSVSLVVMKTQRGFFRPLGRSVPS